MDGKQSEGQVSEPPSSQDKPLTHPSNPVSYAGSVKRVEPVHEGTPPPTGKPPGGATSLFSTSPPSGLLSTSPQRLESYAEVVRGLGGPQDIAVDIWDVSSEIGAILAGRGNPCNIIVDMHRSVASLFLVV